MGNGLQPDTAGAVGNNRLCSSLHLLAFPNPPAKLGDES